ncbi:hypothetical protein BLEM_1719 [Bifidobacterium lemurum]|uniref:Fimbrial subunit FimA n=1 Tax=Bifidobacterium lemurum TaxID=1603886 RepID=A0A261FN92_9BIFI|nr:isopeptide-forming domain-containing fimbrial protein [Bifidobacterium lemurum]OZG60650.1 hypothetical protein BLEM_1719 [Bifidobacterium lemurum]QOL34829.1 isopeptide-forming domain-containing fimbrial protein [Bifidobacterium lemurum]
MKMRKLFAGIAAAATMLGGLALGVTTANAIEGDASTITITGDVANRTFTAYLLGTYTNVVNDGTKATSVDFTQNTAWNPTIADAAKAAVGDVPAEYTGNELAYIATLNQTMDGEELRKFAETLATATDKPEPPTTVTTRDTDTQAVLDVPTEGWYLVTDSTGAPILVGTKIANPQGGVFDKLNDTTLGTAVAKPTTIPTPVKEVIDAEGHKVDDPSALVGSTVRFKVTSAVPNYTGFNTYDWQIEDTPSAGLTIDQSSVTVAVSGVNSFTDYTATVDNGKLTVAFNDVTKLTIGADITVTYDATVTKDAIKADNSGVTNSVIAKHDGKTSGEGKVTVKTFTFDFTKQNADGGALAGAKFVIRSGNKYLKQDEDTKAWSEVTNVADATSFTSAQDTGKVVFEGLAAGEYTVEETEVPEGFLQSVKPSFTVTIYANGTIAFGADTFGLVNTTDKTVKNVKSITQLPLTGAAGTALFTVIALLVAGAAVTVYAKSRKTAKAMMA